MGQKDNFYEVDNREDRKKNSKYEVGDLIERQLYNKIAKKQTGSRRFFIFEKRKLKDKKSEYWVYDIFFPDNNDVWPSVRLVDDGYQIYIKLA